MIYERYLKSHTHGILAGDSEMNFQCESVGHTGTNKASSNYRKDEALLFCNCSEPT